MNRTKTLQQQIGEIYRAKALIATHQAHGRRTRWRPTRRIRFLFKEFSVQTPNDVQITVVRIRWDIIHTSFCLKCRVFCRVWICSPFVFHQIFVFYSLSSSCPWLARLDDVLFSSDFFFLFLYFIFGTNKRLAAVEAVEARTRQRCAMRYGRYTSMANLVSLLSHTSTHSPTRTAYAGLARVHQQTLICSLNLVEFRLSEMYLRGCERE